MKALQRTFVFPVFLMFIISSMWLPSAQAEEIPLRKVGGVYTIPVELNGVLTLQFILDTGAAEVQIPADVTLTLIRAGTIQQSDFLPGRSYTLADGTTVQSPRFVLQRLKIGTRLLTQVPASIGDLSSVLLLGQSVLERLGTWSMDNQRRMLVLGPVPTLNERVVNKETMPTLGSGAQQLATSTGQTYVRQMITYAMTNGGVGNEAALLATKRRIEALQPKRLADAPARKRARTENERGLQFINNGQIAEAAQAFQAAYEADPTDVEIINNLGDAYQRLYNLQAAEPLLLKALVFTPGRANAWANLGHTYAKQGQYNVAVACYANAYRFSRNQDTTRQLLQKWAVEEEEGVRTVAQQTLQLPMVQSGISKSTAPADAVGPHRPWHTGSTITSSGHEQGQINGRAYWISADRDAANFYADHKTDTEDARSAWQIWCKTDAIDDSRLCATHALPSFTLTVSLSRSIDQTQRPALGIYVGGADRAPDAVAYLRIDSDSAWRSDTQGWFNGNQAGQILARLKSGQSVVVRYTSSETKGPSDTRIELGGFNDVWDYMEHAVMHQVPKSGR